MEIVAQQEEKLIRDYPKMSHPIVWIAGEDLSNLVKKYNPQFIWGVLSAFDKSINIDINNLLVEPYANGNEGLGYQVQIFSTLKQKLKLFVGIPV